MLSYAKLQAVAANALQNGGSLRSLPEDATVSLTDRTNTGTVIDWNIAGSCNSPREALLAATTTQNGQLHRLRVYLAVRCRKCDPCLRYRAMNWRERCEAEILSANRTWFGSLTFTPIQHKRADHEIALKAIEGSELDPSLLDDEKVEWVLSMLSPEVLWSERQRVLGREMTLYMKRLRESLDVPLRYVIITERHKMKLRGRPHFHVLIHETGLPIRKRELKQAWSGGHVMFKLADRNSAYYVTKYLTKESSARVRASFRYGKLNNDLDHNLPASVNRGVSGGMCHPAQDAVEDVLETTTTNDDEQGARSVPSSFAALLEAVDYHDEGGARLPRAGVSERGGGFQTVRRANFKCE